MSSALRYAWFASLLLASSCYPPGDGREPSLDRIYFPVGLALDPDANELYVVNSDFDLQFNAGTVQALDLQEVRALLPRPCGADADCDAGRVCDLPARSAVPSYFCVDPDSDNPCAPLPLRSAAERLIVPGLCGHIDPASPPAAAGVEGSLIIEGAAVSISAFATDVLYRARPDGGGGRLFIPVRGDATLHYIDVAPDGHFECDQEGAIRRCGDRHRVGDEPAEETRRGQRMAAEPFGVAASPDGSAILTTHQTEGAVSLFVNDWDAGPELTFVLGGLPSRPIGIAALPELVAGQHEAPGFLVTFRNAAEVRLLRYFSAAKAGEGQAYVQDLGQTDIRTNSVGFDSRGIAVDETERRACGARCAPDETECLEACATLPVGVYVANRTPSSLLVGATQPASDDVPSDDLPEFFDVAPLPFGASRIVTGTIINTSGEPEPRVFVLSFDARRLLVYDPARRREETWITTGRGPHALAIDAAHGLGYVAHFTDSYIGVLDLDQRHRTFGQLIATIGRPTPPRASK
ncbi:MAG TPA: hypothetical protein VKZ49_06170 [Polyangiaceae bacterium]|nr:hypothetical protein [Polyangiaceae bacterium]